MVLHQKGYRNQAKTFLFVSITRLGPKWDFVLGPCERFYKFIGHFKHLFKPKIDKKKLQKKKYTNIVYLQIG